MLNKETTIQLIIETIMNNEVVVVDKNDVSLIKEQINCLFNETVKTLNETNDKVTLSL